MTAKPTPTPVAVRMPPGYEFVTFIGRGGNGYVVCARQTDLDRSVAIKMIYGGALAAGGTARLQREGRVLARLNHPNVVRVFAAIPMADDLALVLEFVDGMTLESALAAGALDLAETFVVLEDIASALEHCAQSDIAHRDLKPANVLLTAAGRAKVADFGLARLSRTAAAFRTDTGVASGTPAYMAPEQITDPDREDPASDSYSFALIAHRALTGVLPVTAGETRDSVRLAEGLTDRAEQVFRRALCTEPTARVRPRELIAQLRAMPEQHSWSSAASTGFVQSGPTARPDSTEAGAATSGRTEADAATSGLTEGVGGTETTKALPHIGKPAGLPMPSGDGAWVDVPVYAPPRKHRRLALSPAVLGVLVGVAIALLALAFAARG